MPNLTRLELLNFRGIQKGSVSGFADVTLIVGRNNSGKSTVAEAVMTLAAAVDTRQAEPWKFEDAAGRVTRWSKDRNEAPQSGERWYREDRSKVLALVGWFEGVGLTMRCGGGQTGLVGVPQPEPPAAAALARAVDFLPVDAVDAGIEKAFWPKVLAPRKDKALVVSVNEIFGMQVEQIQLPPDGRLLLLLPDRAIALDAHGAGTRAALRALIKLALAHKTLFVMEHPETHQHPGSLMRLGAAMCAQARQSGTELIITTHSLECIRAFLEGSAKAGSSFAVLHLSLTDGQLSVRSIDADTLRGLERSGTDVRDLDLYA